MLCVHNMCLAISLLEDVTIFMYVIIMSVLVIVMMITDECFFDVFPGMVFPRQVLHLLILLMAISTLTLLGQFIVFRFQLNYLDIK